MRDYATQHFSGAITDIEYTLVEGGEISGRATVRNVLLRSGGYPPEAFEPTVDYPYPVGEDTARFVPVNRAPEIPRPAPATATDVVLAVVCLIGVFGFGMALAAGLVSIAERLAVAP